MSESRGRNMGEGRGRTVDERDGFDPEGLLGRIHLSQDGFVPGSLTRQRRARAGAWSVAGVGAVAAAGLVVSGVLTPDGGSSPQAAPPATAAATPRPSTPSATPQGGVTGEAVAYVTTAQRAFDAVDLADLVVVSTASGWFKHPGEKRRSDGVGRAVTAGDGHATRTTFLTPMDGAVNPEHKGVEELSVAVPGRTDGRMTYWYIDPVAGVYATFPLPAKTKADVEVPPIPHQIADFTKDMAKTLAAAKQVAATDGVKAGGPTSSTVNGKDATCLRMAGEGDQAIVAGGPGSPADAGMSHAWSWRVCFDPATRLPVLSQYELDYQLPDLKGQSHESQRLEYKWLPVGPASEKLFAPGVDGLRKVSRDQYVELAH